MYRVKDGAEALDLIKEALLALEREDNVYHYGVANDAESGQQVVYFDVPRISPLQFNTYVTPELETRENVIAALRSAINRRLSSLDELARW